MSSNNSNNIRKSRREEIKRLKVLAMKRNLTMLVLLFILIVGLVSTTFATFVPQQTGSEGTLVADIRTAAVNQGHKEQLADTKANIDVTETSVNSVYGGYVYFDNTVTQWTDSCIQFVIGHNSFSRTYNMTRISNTNLYYVNLSSFTYHDWGDATYYAMIGTSSKWGDGKWGPSNLTNANHRTAAYTTAYSMDADNKRYIVTPNGSANGSTISIAYQGTTYSSLNKTNYVYAKSADSGSTTYSNDSSAGTVKITGYYLTGDNTSSSHSATSTLNSSYSASVTAVPGSTLTLTATENSGYKFVGWYTSSGTLVSTSLTCTTPCTDALTYHARYEKDNPFEAGDTIYFDARGSTAWSNNTVYVQCNTNTTSSGSRYEMTKIGTYLYKYTFDATSAAISGSVRIWSGSYYSRTLSKTDYATTNGVYVTATTANTGTLANFVIGTVNTPTLTLSDTDIIKGDTVTLTCSTPVLNYTRAGTSYTTTPTGVTYVYKQGTTTLASSSTGSYDWKPANYGTYSLTVQISATASGKSSSASSAKTLYVRPAAPTALTFSALNSIKGTGTSADPFIAFEKSSFKINAKATVASDAVAHYSTSANDDYSATSQFTPSEANKGTKQSLLVYAKAYAGDLYSTNFKSGTAYYMVFTHLDGDNITFDISSTDITDSETITLSNAKIVSIADAEQAYISHTYQVSNNNSTFTDLTDTVWSPDAIGTYYFRVKTTNSMTGETVYSTVKNVVVKQSTVYYDIKVTNDGDTDGRVTLKTDGTTITDNKILSNSPLSVTVLRPSNTYYFEYFKVDGETVLENYNGDITDLEIISHVKGDVTIDYKLALKPTVKVSKPSNSSAISFKYYSDGTLTTVTAAGTYYVDYDSTITYTVTPNTGYYVSSMTGVNRGTISAGPMTGSRNNVVSTISSVTAKLTKNKTFTVNIDSTSAATAGSSMSVDGSVSSFNTAIPLNYGAESTVVITPPEGCFALVTGSSVSSTVTADGKATFIVILTGSDKTYTVKFVKNPKIYIEQPQYGSVYVTDNLGNYYFHGDSVGYGTELTVHVKPDHANAKLTAVLINDASIGTTDGSKFEITEDSTASATITVDSKHTFSDHTEYGSRRIFFTDNSGWGDGQVMIHYSNTNNDHDFTDGNVKEMTFKYINDASQRVYYADIPYSFKYVNFYKKSATSNYTASALISNDANGYWHEGGAVPYVINPWQENYSDYIATDRTTSIQQAATLKNKTVKFAYSCDYGDAALSLEVVSGNSVDYDFDKGTLLITPTDNTHSYSLVKVTSSASTTVKYYLIRVENFEIISFSGIQKIYNTNVLNSLQLDLIVKGGVLNYASKFFVSDTNAEDSFEPVVGNKESGFSYVQSLESYINSFLIEYNVHTVSGVKYYMVEANDGAGNVATAYAKTLFGTNTFTGERCLYFYNATGENLSNNNIRACFTDISLNNRTFVTMQRVGNTDYYRAVVPDNREYNVHFFICNKNTFSNNWADYDGTDDSSDIYTFSVTNLKIPSGDDANIVYTANSLASGGSIKGDFTEFDY